ncbi:MAG: hypothetical protein GF334_00990 [Candidatus Altiarchaeales archaeon]|nr:hypothetical protein [Candidatus Altiarchaeales archaeon]
MDDVAAGEVVEYLTAHNLGTIAVTDGLNPGAHSVYYVNKGLRIYFESNPQSQKIHILGSNPRVSMTVDEDYGDWRKIKGVQLFGKATVADQRRAPKLHGIFESKFPHLHDLGGLPDHHVFVEVIPEKIYFMDFSKGFGHKEVYYPDNLKSLIKW